MPIENQGSVRPVSSDPFRFQYNAKDFTIDKPAISTQKGMDVLDGLLLDQYSNSDNLRAYFAAFFEEMDLLFNSLDAVYVGRMLDYAIGHQLDVIGVILNQNRRVSLSGFYFGFEGDARSQKMADEATPSDGGVFYDGDSEGYDNVPLTDVVYRNLLRAKAHLHTRHAISITDMYNTVFLMLGRVPSHCKITVNSAQNVTLELPALNTDISANDLIMVQYVARYMVPMGTTLFITTL